MPAAISLACDPGDLAEILSNLIDNACKWAASAVRITATAGPEWIDIEVADDGPGIPPAERARVLEIGVRLDRATQGTGLGLTISRDIAALYGGTLHLRSVEDGPGLLAVLRVPAR